MAESKKKAPFLMYKGRPLVRKGNTLYYGSMAEPFVIMMQITSTKKVKELNTDPDVRPRERIVKKSEKNGLYDAMDVGSIWLDRALQKS